MDQPTQELHLCSSTPTDAHAIPGALPSPARAVVLARANAALSEIVLCGHVVRPMADDCLARREQH